MQGINEKENSINSIKVSYNTGSAIYASLDVIAEKAIDVQYSRQPELLSIYGEKGKDLSIKDTKYHLQYLSEALCFSSKSLFSSYIIWARILLENLQIPLKYVKTNLEIIKETILKEPLSYGLTPEQTILAGQYLDAGIKELEKDLIPEPSFLTEDADTGKIAKQYLTYHLDGERNKAFEMILRVIDEGVPIEKIYMEVIQPSQYEIGRLWHIHQASVAQEHYVTASSQLIMSQLYQNIISQNKKGKSLVATCVGSELHEMGVRMVADLFELDGWDTYYLGANMPSSSIIEIMKQTNSRLLVLSATLPLHVHKVKALIKEIKNDSLCKDMKIMVGGYPFNIDKQLWEKVGADMYAPDAKTAVRVANQLI